jgi:hypothetical protein
MAVAVVSDDEVTFTLEQSIVPSSGSVTVTLNGMASPKS